MHTRIAATLLISLTLLAGCASSGVSGTWQGRGAESERPFSFGSVTFAPDGTYTAEARYGDTTRAVSGTWSMTGNTMILYGEPFGERTYTVDQEKDMLVFTDPQSGGKMTLDRFK